MNDVHTLTLAPGRRVFLPLLLPQSHGHDASQAPQDAGHAVQVVDSAGVLYAQVGGQDGLQEDVEETS